jgi:predicted extracellular nuclease
LRHLIQRYSIGLMLLVAILGLVSCGKSEKSLVPVVENPFEGVSVGTDTTLEITTWNLEHFAKKGDETVTKVVQAIEAMDVDIIALQEIQDFTYFRQLRQTLESWDGDRATSAGYDINLAFLYRIDGDLEVDSVYEILVEFRREFPRRPLVLEGRYNDVPIVVINNHYKCCGNGTIDEEDERDEETRRRDASLLLDEFIRNNYEDKHVVVVGDFNDSLTDIPERNVFQNFIGAPDDYRFVDMGIAEGPGTGWSFPGWPSHLDHILVGGSLFEAISGNDAEVMVIPLHSYFPNGLTGYDPLISDHLPVVLKMGL